MTCSNYYNSTPYGFRAALLATVITGITLLVLLSPGASAQNREELRYLIFEPVVIEITGNEGELQVNELTSLPTAESPAQMASFIQQSAVASATSEADNLEDSILQYEEEIRRLELLGGAYEASLSQQHFAMGTLHQSLGEHAKALDYFDQALHVNRVNLGLFNLDQEEIIEEKIKSHIALGDLQAADMEQEYLFYLKRKAYGNTSLELLPALHQYAEWNIFAFDSRLSVDPTLAYASEARVYTENSVNNSIGEENFRTIRLMNAQNIYRTIIQILLNNYGTTDPRLLEVERKLALTNYFFATNLNFQSSAFNSNNSSFSLASSQGYYDMSRVSTNSMGYRHGRDALERRLEYMLSMDDIDPVDIALARVELGDWLLLFKKRMASLDMYEQAYNEMAASGATREQLDKIFSPRLPQTIPTFIDYRYTRGAWDIPQDLALEYKGWLDIRLKINRYGQPQDVELLDTSETVTEPIADRLLSQLRSSTSFRPRFHAGELLREDTLEARYYFTY